MALQLIQDLLVQLVNLLVQIRVQVSAAGMVVRIAPVVERGNVAVLVDFGIALEVGPREFIRFAFDRLGRGFAGRVQTLAGHLDLVDVVPGVVLDDDALE